MKSTKQKSRKLTEWRRSIARKAAIERANPHEPTPTLDKAEEIADRAMIRTMRKFA